MFHFFFKKFDLGATLYPEEGKVAIKNWLKESDLSSATIELVKCKELGVSSKEKESTASATKELSKLDSKLKECAKPYFLGKNMSVVDYLIFGDLVILKHVLNYDFKSLSAVKSYFSEMEKLESYKAMVSEIEQRKEEFMYLTLRKIA
jgi:glutathione S-transferase